MKGRPRSLRTRLVGLAALTSFVVAVLAAAAAVAEIRHVADRALRDAATTRLAAVRSDVSPAGRIGSTTLVRRTATYAQVLDASGRVVSASPALRDAPALLPLDQARRGVSAPVQLNLGAPDVDLALIAAPLTVNGAQGAVIVGVDSQAYLDARRQLQVVVLIAVPLVVALTALSTWVVTGRALRVVTTLAEEADVLGAATSRRGLAVATPDRELARLVEALNRMLARLNSHYAANLAAAAETTHRLRTPLATMRAEAELALSADEPAAAREALTRVIEDSDRLTAVVDRLLSSAGGRADVADLGDAVATATAAWQRQAAAAGQMVTVACTGSGRLDHALLHAVCDPLVENAIRFAAAGSPVTIDVRTDGAAALVRVGNTGPGVAADVREELFVPWTGRRTGGLGLWLSRESALAAGGAVWCEEPGPPVTVFTARLPLVA